ncbi:SIR2 family protein [Pseudoalteromonas fuliginea]|uniref:SIR2 family protein n=1 Tax=Pseudoalteromonas fuliginea TaxID=1872678 RepID=UPI00317688E5
MKSENIFEISNLIKNSKLAIFFGAGLDFYSGVPLVKGEHGIMTKILSQLPFSAEDNDFLLNMSNMPFEAFFSILGKHSNIDHLLEIFNIGKPNKNHYIIAKAIKCGYIKTVVTTNFTEHIEQALEFEGMVEGKDYLVARSDSDFMSIDLEGVLPVLIKIHGCISRKEELVITIEKVAKKAAISPRERIVEHLVSSVQHEAVLVMGYSCSDVFDLTPMFKRGSCKNKIYHLNHEHSKNRLDSLVFSENLGDFKGFYHPNAKGALIQANTDFVIDELAHQTDKYFSSRVCALSNKQLTEFQDKVSKLIESWALQFNSIKSNAFSYFISGELLNNASQKISAIPYYEESLKISILEHDLEIECMALNHLAFLYASSNPKQAKLYSERGFKIAKSIKDKKMMSLHLRNLGVSERNQSNFEESLFNLTKSLKLCSISDMVFRGKVHMEIGISYKAIEKYKSAETHFLKASELFKVIGSVTDVGWSIGNLGNIYFHHFNCYKKAEINYKEALNIAKKMDHTFNIGVWTGNLGIMYLRQGKLQKAFVAMNDALSIAIECGDNIGQGKWHENIAEYFVLSREFKYAAMHLDKSIEIAISLGDSSGKERRLIALNSLNNV